MLLCVPSLRRYAKKVGELQALSSVVTFVHGDACLSYIPQFVAKSELLTRSIPRSFLAKSLSDFAAGLDDDLLLCPVRALRIAYSCLLVAPRARFRKTLSRSSCAKLFLMLELLDLRWVESGLMTSVVFPPPSPSTVTGLSPRFWIQPPGAPVRCSPPFTCVTSNTSMMAFCLWVRLWLRARGSGSPHLFLTCSGGGGGPVPFLSPLLHGSFTCFSGWMRDLPIQ